MEKNKKRNLRSQINKGLEIPRVYKDEKENALQFVKTWSATQEVVEQVERPVKSTLHFGTW